MRSTASGSQSMLVRRFFPPRGILNKNASHSPPPDIAYHRPPVSEVSEVSDRSIVSQATYISASKAAVWCGGGVCW